MTKLEELALAGVRSVELTVRLVGPAGEIQGGGYAPHVVSATLGNGRLTYPKCLFRANGDIQRPIEVTGYVCEIEGERVHSKDFPEPFFFGGDGDEIEVEIDAKTK